MNVMRRRLCALFLLALLALVPLGASAAFADGEPEDNPEGANPTTENVGETEGQDKELQQKPEGKTPGEETGKVGENTKDVSADDGEKDLKKGNLEKVVEEEPKAEEKPSTKEESQNLTKGNESVTPQEQTRDVPETKSNTKDTTDPAPEDQIAAPISAKALLQDPTFKDKEYVLEASGDTTLNLDADINLKSIKITGGTLTIQGAKSLVVYDGIKATSVSYKENAKLNFPSDAKFDPSKETYVDKDGKEIKLVGFNADVFTVKFEPASLNIKDQQVLKGEKAQVPSNTPKSVCKSSGWYNGSKKLEDSPITANTTFTWKTHLVQHYDAKAATCTNRGNTEFWWCKTCEKYFKDEACQYELEESAIIIPATGHEWNDWTVTKKATTKAAGEKQRTCKKCGEVESEVIPRLVEYTFSKGANSTWTKGGSSDLEVVVKRNYDDKTTHGLFVEVLVDDKTVDSKNYTTESGSLKLKLKKSYLDTLSEKEHSVEIKFEDGSAKTKLTVKPAPAKTSAAKSPSTGETIPAGVIIAIVVVAVVAVAAIIIARRRMA